MSENIENSPSTQVSEEGISAVKSEQAEQGSQQPIEEKVSKDEDKPTGGGEVQAPPAPEKEEAVVEAPKNIEEARELVKTKGFDYEELQQEFNAQGGLSEETIKALESQGISRKTIEKFTNDQKQLVAQQMSEIVDYIGGEDTFTSIRNWAIANLSDDEKAEIDREHNPTRIKLLLDGLKARMEMSEGKIPNTLSGGGGEPSDNLFESLAEMRAAIKDPRYNEDEVYREKVSKKITASKNAGKIRL